MQTIITILISIIVVIHLYFLVLEMFLWAKRGPKVFPGLQPDFFIQTQTLAANQGLYNGFLAAGLFWSLFVQDPIWKMNIAVFFLSCMAIAGVYGGITSSKKIIYFQAIPAIVTLLLIFIQQAG